MLLRVVDSEASGCVARPQAWSRSKQRSSSAFSRSSGLDMALMRGTSGAASELRATRASKNSSRARLQTEVMAVAGEGAASERWRLRGARVVVLLLVVGVIPGRGAEDEVV